MRKLLLSLILLLFTSGTAFSMQVPTEIQDFVNQIFPNTNFRFDGAIILPDNTMYLPIFPANPNNVEEINIQSTYPLNETLKQKPDMVIFNNKYVLLKVINTNGKKTVINMTNPPDELQSGLLPQDILLPKGLVIPDSLKGIIGDLDVTVAQETGLRINNTRHNNKKSTTPVEQLDNKTFYISTGSNKNIQVINSNSKEPAYSLSQDFVINDIKGFDGKYLLVTYFDSKIMNIISLMDEKVIKQVNFETIPEQIVIDKENDLAYISSGSSSSIYVFSLKTMTLKRQLKINGHCEKLTLSSDGTKIFYVDRNKNDIWAIELDNNYLLKNIGSFPNISEIIYVNGKIYTISRTQNRLAIVDYETLNLINELEVCEKPVDLFAKGKELYILGAKDNILEILDTEDDVVTDKLFLNTNAFATNITPIDNSDMIMITNARSGLYSVVDTIDKDIVKTSPLDVPVRAIVITDKVKTIK
ncbi:hypothetical protein IJ579_02280 [bacterium]|nr:hypothetical protein [bacterium]